MKGLLLQKFLMLKLSDFETALTWIGAQGDTDPAYLLLVQKWRNLCSCETYSNSKANQISVILYYSIVFLLVCFSLFYHPKILDIKGTPETKVLR